MCGIPAPYAVFSPKQEEDVTRHRTVLVARLTPVAGGRPVPPLFDVALVSSTGEVWTLAGYERVQSGALQQEYTLGQSWIVRPASLDDLRHAENQWGRLAHLLDELKSAAAEKKSDAG